MRWRGLALLLLGGPALAAGPAATPGYAPAGRAIVVDRTVGLCLLCHGGPFPEERHPGNLAPSLAGVGARLSAAQLRRQLLEPQSLNPESIMPSYGPRESDTRADTRVASAWRGRPLLDAQQIEDVVAFLQTLH